MKKILSIIATFAFVLVLSSCWLLEKTIVGDGDISKNEYLVSSASELEIDHINLEDHGNPIYTHLYAFENDKSDEFRVVIEGQRNILDSIKVKSKSDKLAITGNFYEKYDTESLTIKLYGFSFEKIDLTDVRGSMVSKMVGEDVNINLVGTAFLSCPSFSTKKFTANLKDASSLAVGVVEAEETTIKMGDSTNFSATSLDSKKCTINVENSSIIETSFNSNALKLDVSGTSRGTIQGNVNKAEIEVSGSSKIEGIDCSFDTVDASILGASSLSFHVVSELKAFINGDSILTYSGDCKEKIDASGEAIINHIS